MKKELDREKRVLIRRKWDVLMNTRNKLGRASGEDGCDEKSYRPQFMIENMRDLNHVVPCWKSHIG